MGKNEKLDTSRVMELLRENGIVVTTEQAEQLLRSSTTLEKFQLDTARQSCAQQIINGYKVYIQYEPISEEEMKEIKSNVARIVSQAIKKL